MIRRRHVFTDCDRVFEADSEAGLLALLDSHGVSYITWTPPLATGRAPDLQTETVSYPGGGAGYPDALHGAIDRVLVRCWAEAAAPDLPRGRVHRSRRLRGRRTNAIAGEL